MADVQIPNPNADSPAKSVVIFDHLKANGYNVYFPGEHQGECREPYTVVKISNLGEVAGTSTDFRLYDLLMYVPRDEYASLEPYVDSIKFCMKALYPLIVSTRFETASFYDDSVKAHMVSMQYRNARKHNNWQVSDYMPDWR